MDGSCLRLFAIVLDMKSKAEEVRDMILRRVRMRGRIMVPYTIVEEAFPQPKRMSLAAVKAGIDLALAGMPMTIPEEKLITCEEWCKQNELCYQYDYAQGEGVFEVNYARARSIKFITLDGLEATQTNEFRDELPPEIRRPLVDDDWSIPDMETYCFAAMPTLRFRSYLFDEINHEGVAVYREVKSS